MILKRILDSRLSNFNSLVKNYFEMLLIVTTEGLKNIMEMVNKNRYNDLNSGNIDLINSFKKIKGNESRNDK